MKKLLATLCVAACGIGAAAQAQIEVHPGVSHIERQVVRRTRAELPAAQTFDAPQFRQAGARYDTLRWHGEYDPLAPNCGNYLYYVQWGSTNGYFGQESALHGFGSNINGTGEIGATFETAGNLYVNYSGHKLEEWAVVGAMTYVYRQGSLVGWDRGHDISQFGTHVTEVQGYKVPDLPYKMAGYYVEEQPAVEDYMATSVSLVQLKMPVSIEGRAESPVDYVPFLEGKMNSNNVMVPQMQRKGGMFDKALYADRDFGVSFHAQLTGDATYDSLWNFAIGVKSPDDCTMLNEWASWTRIDYSDPKAWNCFWNKDGSELDVSKPYDQDGFAPEGCPQHDNGKSLFVYVFSQLLQANGEHFLPAIYGIIQYGVVDNEKNQDAYAQTISVYPMPASEKVNMVSLDPMQRIEIYNMAGSLLKHVTLNESVAEMDVTDLAPGTYIAKIVTEKGVASKKLLVK